MIWLTEVVGVNDFDTHQGKSPVCFRDSYLEVISYILHVVSPPLLFEIIADIDFDKFIISS